MFISVHLTLFLFRAISVTFCPSVYQTHAHGQNEILFCPHSYPTTRRLVGGGRPLVPEIFAQMDPPPSEKATSNRYSLVAPLFCNIHTQTGYCKN